MLQEKLKKALKFVDEDDSIVGVHEQVRLSSATCTYQSVDLTRASRISEQNVGTPYQHL